VGLPLALDGGEHRLTGLARKFAQRLHGLPHRNQAVDERLTLWRRSEARESPDCSRRQTPCGPTRRETHPEAFLMRMPDAEALLNQLAERMRAQRGHRTDRNSHRRRGWPSACIGRWG
jgi:hypothetical protein